MAYIIKNNPDHLFFLDYSQRNGLYYKQFTHSRNLRTNILYAMSTEHFAATQDDSNQIHIVCKDKHNQLVHFTQNSSNLFDNNVILEDSDNNFRISNFKFVTCEGELFLFYTARNPNENTSDIIQHKITSKDEPPQSVIPVTSLNSNYECFNYNGKIYLLSINEEDYQKHELQLSIYDPAVGEWEYYDTLASTPHPITYCSMCIDNNDTFHIIYTQNQNSTFVTQYMKLEPEDEYISEAYSCPFDINPIIFVYDGTLWINWFENNNLYMQLSTDFGESFSKPQLCSLQDTNIKVYHYLYDPDMHPNLQGSSFYGAMDTYPKLAILNQLDMDNIHINTKPNNELKLYVSTLKSAYTNAEKEQYEKLMQENDELKRIQEKITGQYEELSKLAKNLQKEGKKWRNKYYSAELELRSYKTQFKKMKDSNKPLGDS
ncbi:hypothetical protein [Vallitalea okinawensis]|uniref:hypothetical protein n=1 Tax=Vallitalea okinawensis TaxID=2078660 RepID=UPI000CFB81ED|nr:hypothetical protein [Vallitalea okinawensis]